jgi:HD-GYP domain-containing protein (c-di-GMP phosphodiesterase class II)
MSSKGHSSAVSEIRTGLRQLSTLNTFMVFVLFAVAASSLYQPVSGLLGSLPRVSLLFIIAFVLLLALGGSLFSRALGAKVVRNIDTYSHRLNRVLGLSQEIREEVHSDIIIEKIIDVARELTGSDAGCLLLLEDEHLVFKSARGTGIPDIRGMSVPLGSSISGWVAEHVKPFRLDPGKAEEGLTSSLEWLAEYRVQSALCVPLLTKRGIVGVIELLNKRDGAYGEKDLDLTLYLASQAAAALEKAAFYEDQRNYEVHVTDLLVDTIDYLMTQRKGHSRMVATYTGILAKALHMTEEERRRLHFAALLHDIGHLKTILENGSERNAEQFHPTLGFEVLNAISFYRDFSPFVLHHHEHFDGTGHPSGLGGNDIPLEARMIAVAEAFEELVHPVHSFGAENYETALMTLEEKGGSELDPHLVKLFIENFKESMDMACVN